MHLKKLIIDSDIGNIRTIDFHIGMNLIIDETIHFQSSVEELGIASGNSLGKTTVLKLIDFCLGSDKKEIYTDAENDKNVDFTVRQFLFDHAVVVTLILKENLTIEESNEIVLKRNFKARNEKLSTINGEQYTNDKEYCFKLRKLLYPDLTEDKPTLSQLIANNIRYKDIRINNTINNLNANTKPFEYETLYLYMLGCPVDTGEQKLELQAKIKQEQLFLKKLLNNKTKTAYVYALKEIKSSIESLQKKKNNLNINEEYQKDIDKLDEIKLRLSMTGEQITALEIKIGIIRESIKEIEENSIAININELKMLYNEVSAFVEEVQKSFEDLVQYNEIMLKERKMYLDQELDMLSRSLFNSKNDLLLLLQKEREYTEKVKKCDTLEDLERINKLINEQYQKIGEYEGVIEQIEKTEKDIDIIVNEMKKLETNVFSTDFIKNVVSHIETFNHYFAKYSKLLYNELFYFKHEIKETRQGQKYYQFNPYSMSTSSGKKQGEALAFDLAYIEYARSQRIYHLDFLLNDKKELMDINQIMKLLDVLKEQNIQLVISMLCDKIPSMLNNDDYVILRLSQLNKLFRIEELKERYDK